MEKMKKNEAQKELPMNNETTKAKDWARMKFTCTDPAAASGLVRMGLLVPVPDDAPVSSLPKAHAAGVTTSKRDASAEESKKMLADFLRNELRLSGGMVFPFTTCDDRVRALFSKHAKRASAHAANVLSEMARAEGGVGGVVVVNNGPALCYDRTDGRGKSRRVLWVARLEE